MKKFAALMKSSGHPRHRYLCVPTVSRGLPNDRPSVSPFLLWALFFLAGLVDVAVGAGRAATRGTRPWLPLAVGWLGVTLSQCLAIRAATIRPAVALALLAPLGVAALAAEAEMRRGCSLRELETTAREFLSAYGGLTQLTAERFVLPTLEPKLHRLRETLIHGIGFEVIRGIPVHRLSEELASTMFLGSTWAPLAHRTPRGICWGTSAMSVRTARTPM